MRSTLLAFAIVLLIPHAALAAPKDLPKDQWTLQEKINASIDRGVAWLKRTQQKDGSWAGDFGPAGQTALALYTLLSSDVSPKAPCVTRAAAYLAGLPVKKGTVQDLAGRKKPAIRMTYAHSLTVLALTSLDARKHKRTIQRSVTALIGSQKKSGQWAYILSMNGPLDSGDNSNTQCALLALRHAALEGFSVPKSVWQRSYDHFAKSMDKGGGWGYGCSGTMEGAYGSMTAVGVASLVICKAMLLGRKEAGRFKYLRISQIRRGLVWLEENFTADRHPGIADVKIGGGGPPGGPPGGGGGMALPALTFQYYWLYSAERVGMLLNIPYLGDHDWYREGATWLVEQQGPDGVWSNPAGAMMAPEPPLAATCFALLFLKKATLPVVTPPVDEKE